uniref:Uncharacterized protein n=1 Tax=Anguilla anguilla TaxID=7936 RepID=A0A0E9UA88_ANGAN
MFQVSDDWVLTARSQCIKTPLQLDIQVNIYLRQTSYILTHRERLYKESA